MQPEVRSGRCMLPSAQSRLIDALTRNRHQARPSGLMPHQLGAPATFGQFLSAPDPAPGNPPSSLRRFCPSNGPRSATCHPIGEVSLRDVVADEAAPSASSRSGCTRRAHCIEPRASLGTRTRRWDAIDMSNRGSRSRTRPRRYTPFARCGTRHRIDLGHGGFHELQHPDAASGKVTHMTFSLKGALHMRPARGRRSRSLRRRSRLSAYAECPDAQRRVHHHEKPGEPTRIRHDQSQTMIPPSGLGEEPVPRLALFSESHRPAGTKPQLLPHILTAGSPGMSHINMRHRRFSRHCLCSPIIPIGY